MAFKSLISSIFKEFSGSKENFLYLSLPEKMMDLIPEIAEIEKENVVDLQEEYSPLKPFMKIIQQCHPSKSLIEKETYKIQQKFFLDYFLNDEISDRHDMVVLEELFFEKSSIAKTIVSLFSHLVDKNLVIKNAQCLSQESINILKILSKEKLKAKIIFCFDNNKIENSPQNLIEFVDSISHENNFYEVNDDGTLIYQDSIKQFDFPSFEELYKFLKSCRIFLDLTQGQEASKWILANMDNMILSTVQKRYLYIEMAIISLFLGNTDEASFYLNNVVENHAFDDGNLSIEGMIYMTQVMYMKNAFVSALKYVNLVLQHLENDKDNFYYALAYMWNYKITERSETDSAFEKYEKSQKLLDKAGLYNNSINISLIVPWKQVNSQEGRLILKPIIEDTIEKAKNYGNLFLLSSAYHWYGILVSYIDNTDECLNWYYKCNEIRTQIGEFSSIVKIRNGLSYEQLIRTKFKESYNLINSFLSRITEINDYPEVIITLSNVAKILLYSRHFDEAYNFFQKVMYLQHLFGMEVVTYNSFVPTYKDILILKSYIDLIRGDVIHTKIALHNVETSLAGITPSLVPFIDFCWAVVHVKESNISESEKHIELALKDIKSQGESLSYISNFMIYEYALELEKCGFTEKSQEYFNKGLQFAKKKNFEYYIYDEGFSGNDYISRYEKFDPIDLNLEILMEKAEKERLMVQLHKRLRDSQFLNRIMSFASNKSSEINYINSVAQSTFDYMMAEAVFIATKEGQVWNIQASVSRTEIEPPENSEWNKLLVKSGKKGHNGIFYDSEKKLIFANISKFDYVGAVIIYPAQNINFTMEDLSVINVALSNLQAQIVMMKQNEHLLFISSTDQLSMLKNRRALQEQLSIQSEMIRRYSKKRDMYFQTTVVFIDLDNFKYYNDTFGHEAGDLLIQRFGELLRKVFRKVDFISRFGGDEFVALLPNTNCIESKRAAERLHEALEDADYFIPDLCQLLEKNVIIPDNRRIGFSTGICSNYDIEDQTKMDDVMVYADHALYYSKQHGKGSIIIWSDIKDEIENQILPDDEKNRKNGQTALEKK